MQKRRYLRIKRRFPCEIIIKGRACRGIVTDISAAGLFVQTHEALSPGEEVEVRLGGSVASDRK